MPARSILVFEYLSGGILAGPPGLMDLGIWLRNAMAADLATIGGTAVTCAGIPGRTPAPMGCAQAAPQPGEAPLDFVLRQAAHHDFVWAAVPETDGTLLRFAEAIGPRKWIGCNAGSIAVCGSKRESLARLQAAGLPTVQAVDVRDASRWVVKPDDGVCGLGAHWHDSMAAAQDDHAARPGTLLQPWIDGDAMSLSLLCDGRVVELLSVNRQHMRLDGDGSLAFLNLQRAVVERGSDAFDQLADLAERAARVFPGLRGFVGIDFVWHPERGPVLLEINPRITYAWVGLSRILGRPLGREVLNLFPG